MKVYLALILWLLAVGDVPAQAMQEALQDDYIEANVPPEDVFSTYLERDVLAYMRAEISPEITDVKTTLLRQGATQSGTAYPKFYLWVTSTSKGGAVIDGAIRVAAVDRVGFKITRFLSSKEIKDDPQAVASTFPAVIVPDILAKTAVK
jgi:hypothetical protein